jgi:hypothetical protein
MLQDTELFDLYCKWQEFYRYGVGCAPKTNLPSQEMIDNNWSMGEECLNANTHKEMTMPDYLESADFGDGWTIIGGMCAARAPCRRGTSAPASCQGSIIGSLGVIGFHEPIEVGLDLLGGRLPSFIFA